MRQGVHRTSLTSNCPAKRSLSIPSASPHRQQRVIDWGETCDRQTSQTGAKPARSRGLPQAVQSAGKNVVTRSSRRVRATPTVAAELHKTLWRHVTRSTSSPPGGPPDQLPIRLDGVPPETSSVLPFRLSLKTHLPRWRSRSVGPRPERSISPDSPKDQPTLGHCFRAHLSRSESPPPSPAATSRLPGYVDATC